MWNMPKCQYTINWSRNSRWTRLCIPFCVPFLAFQFQESWGITSKFLPKKRNSFLCSLFSKGNFPGIPFCRNLLCSCKNKFLFYPSWQNITIPQHVDQKWVKDVTHNNITRNKKSLLPLSSAAPLICCPLRLAESFSWRVHLSLLNRTHLVWLVVVLLPGGLPLPLSRCLHHLLRPPFVSCLAVSVLTPVALASLPLSSHLCISLHCCTPLWFGWL